MQHKASCSVHSMSSAACIAVRGRKELWLSLGKIKAMFGSVGVLGEWRGMGEVKKGMYQTVKC